MESLVFVLALRLLLSKARELLALHLLLDSLFPLYIVIATLEFFAVSSRISNSQRRNFLRSGFFSGDFSRIVSTSFFVPRFLLRIAIRIEGTSRATYSQRR